MRDSLPLPLGRALLGAGEGSVTHFYRQWKADLDLGGGLKVAGTLGEFIPGVLAAVHHGSYSHQ